MQALVLHLPMVPWRLPLPLTWDMQVVNAMNLAVYRLIVARCSTLIHSVTRGSLLSADCALMQSVPE